TNCIAPQAATDRAPEPQLHRRHQGSRCLAPARSAGTALHKGARGLYLPTGQLSGCLKFRSPATLPAPPIPDPSTPVHSASDLPPQIFLTDPGHLSNLD